MNAHKTQLIWLGTRQQLDKLSTTDLSLLWSEVQFFTTVSNLGVLIDHQLSLANHVALLLPVPFFFPTAATSIGPAITQIRSG